MPIRTLFSRLFTGSAQSESTDEALVALAKQVRDLGIARADDAARLERLELAFNAFRQRVYAWRRWDDPAPSGETPPPEEKPLDKAAILRAHRSKQ